MVDKIWYNMEELIGGSEERGINRNILECKDQSSFTADTGTYRINRNILECKESPATTALPEQEVLIETYWNVKIAPYS